MEANEYIFKYTTEDAIVLGQIFSQTHNLKKGVKKFGDKVLNTTLAEGKQLNARTCFRPIDVKNLTSQEQKWAMESLIFLTDKCDGIIKGQTCANLSIQRDCMNKE